MPIKHQINKFIERHRGDAQVTPDSVLAEYLDASLKAFDVAVGSVPAVAEYQNRCGQLSICEDAGLLSHVSALKPDPGYISPWPPKRDEPVIVRPVEGDPKQNLINIWFCVLSGVSEVKLYRGNYGEGESS